MTRIRASNPPAARSLVDHLKQQGDVVADLVAADEIELTVLGSFARDPMRLEIFLRIRAWEAAERARGRDVSADIVD
jgi:hypothetical protein